MLSRTLLFIAAALGLSEVQGRGTQKPIVDLGYAQYRGSYDSVYDLNLYKGIRYAAPPIGKLRWQLPQPPTSNNSHDILPATENPPQCPQTGLGSSPPGINGDGDEDCLFLNVFAPPDAEQLPVLVWIHGGGYGLGNASMYDLSEQMKTNDNAYISVVIQYRLGAFGFLSSAEVSKFGVPNVGIHDMRAALQWVQDYIDRFGGDPSQVTISGVSAGGGATMLLGMAHNGSESDSLFKGIIADSPYHPGQWDYDGVAPTDSYNRFAKEVGCLTDETTSNGFVFDCLVSTDSRTLKNASDYVSTSSAFGQWAFVPVTDGSLIFQRPAEQLLGGGYFNGIRILTSNAANEGPGYFIPPTIENESDFHRWLGGSYPLLSDQNVTTIMKYYAVPDNYSPILTDTNGLHAPFSTTNSQFAAGWQQAAYNLYAEATFACPSYWLGDAYSHHGKAWRFQFSPPPGVHGGNIDPITSPADIQGTGMNTVFRTAYHHIWRNFIVDGDPTLRPHQLHTGTGGDDIAAAGRREWKQWDGSARHQKAILNMNMTGGVPATSPLFFNTQYLNVTSYVPGNDSTAPPLEAAFQVVDGGTWEGGRAERCQLWADLGPWAKE